VPPGVSDPGWYIIGGTSEATPIMSGIVALADQQARHFRQQQLRRRDRLQRHRRLHLATGWGTINAAKFVPALARLG
jgi:hypothetical protein